MNSRARSLRRPWLGAVALPVLLAAFSGACTPDVKDLRTEGIDLYRNQQHIESMAILREAMEKSPSDAQSNYYMGLNYRTLAERKFRDGDVPGACRQLDNAIRYFGQAVRSWPNYMAAVSAQNEALESRGKYDRALDVAERVARNNRGDSAKHFVFLGNEYRERGDYDNALRAYKTALATSPDMARAYAEMGKLYLQIGNRALATDSLRRARELDPYEPGVADSLARLSENSDVHQAALELPQQ